MVQEGATKCKWDYALDFEAYVTSNTALDIYMLQGEVLENVILGGTSDTVTGLDSEVPTPKVNDNYVNDLVMLPRGNSYASGKVIGLKRKADGNAVGRKNDNPILDTREYRVEFDDG